MSKNLYGIEWVIHIARIGKMLPPAHMKDAFALVVLQQNGQPFRQVFVTNEHLVRVWEGSYALIEK
jgi:hypothetical protein